MIRVKNYGTKPRRSAWFKIPYSSEKTRDYIMKQDNPITLSGLHHRGIQL